MMGNYSALETNELASHEKTWSKFKYRLRESSLSEKDAIQYDCNSMLSWKRQNPGDNKKTSDCQQRMWRRGD